MIYALISSLPCLPNNPSGLRENTSHGPLFTAPIFSHIKHIYTAWITNLYFCIFFPKEEGTVFDCMYHRDSKLHVSFRTFLPGRVFVCYSQIGKGMWLYYSVAVLSLHITYLFSQEIAYNKNGNLTCHYML